MPWMPLVHRRAAAVERERALPPRIILARAVPLHVGAREHDPAEAPGRDRRLERPRACAKPRLKNRRDLHARRLGRAQQFVGPLRRNLDRFLHHEMFARADRRERRLQVRAARRRDTHDGDIGPRHQVRDAGRGEGHPVLRRKHPGIFRVARRNADELRPRGRRDGLRMVVGNHADTDNPEAEGRWSGGSVHR